jgi:hypothetical protein
MRFLLLTDLFVFRAAHDANFPTTCRTTVERAARALDFGIVSGFIQCHPFRRQEQSDQVKSMPN